MNEWIIEHLFMYMYIKYHNTFTWHTVDFKIPNRDHRLRTVKVAKQKYYILYLQDNYVT